MKIGLYKRNPASLMNCSTEQKSLLTQLCPMCSKSTYGAKWGRNRSVVVFKIILQIREHGCTYDLKISREIVAQLKFSE
jgi:hypothetical protein